MMEVDYMSKIKEMKKVLEKEDGDGGWIRRGLKMFQFSGYGSEGDERVLGLVIG